MSVQNSNTENWSQVIGKDTGLFSINLKEIYRYRDLIYMFVKRDFVTFYKQTILGPLWFIIQPALSTIMFYFIFVVLAKTQEKGIDALLFILCGQVIWSYFSDTLNKVSTVFTTNANMFGKVYFPRLIMPLSITVSGLIKFLVQFIIFIIILIYGYFTSDSVKPNLWIIAFPFLVLLMGIFALGLGMIFSSLTTKYKDLVFLLTFGITLYMYATPVVIPLSTFGKYQKYFELNPLTGIFECFRYAFLGNGDFRAEMLIYSVISILITFLIGALIFNKVEKSFMDTV